MCVSERERKREREKERECVCVCVSERERKGANKLSGGQFDKKKGGGQEKERPFFISCTFLSSIFSLLIPHHPVAYS